MNRFKKLSGVFIVLFFIGVLCGSPVCAQKYDNSSLKGYSIFKETLVDLTWPEVKKAAEDNSVVLLPIGVIEEHGPHMCLGTDTYLAYQRCRSLKSELEKIGVKAVIAPAFYWGIMQLNSETGVYPGSFVCSPTTMKAVLSDIFMNLQRWGFHNVFCVNHHGDRLHRKTLAEAIDEAKEKFGLVFYNDQQKKDGGDGPDDKKYITGKIFEPDFHSGISETSAMSIYYPEFVKLKTAETLKPQNTFQPLGYVGDPANYKNMDMAGFDSAESEYYASCIAKWINLQSSK